MESAKIDKKYVLTDVLKRRKQDLNRVEQKVKTKIDKIKNKKVKKTREIIPAEEFVKDYEKKQTAYQAFKKRTLKVLRTGEEVDPEKEKIIIAVRIRGVKDISSEQSKILKILNLRGMMCAVFMKLDTKTLNQLKKVENYVAFGYPTKKLVSELIFKRAYGKIDNQRVQLNSNKVVEDYLGKYGIICLEDLVNEIAFQGPNFEVVNKFLWPFKLSAPYKKFDQQKIIKPFDKKGEWGNRAEKINDLIFSMI